MKGETKEQRFKRVAERRVRRVLDSFRGLSQCSNKRMYNWDEKQLRKMWDAINQAFKGCQDSYKSAEPEEFKL
ncbi:MAG TPA: hypothetical protein ENO17_06185 [Candidatus Atribacteria bacterium]|nr:hypothetical protein [Candidatus Atribacteria bacterium]